MSANSPEDLKRIYRERFESSHLYRKAVWRIITGSFLSDYIPADGAVLDLGCGYGEFINAANCSEKYGMDLNPDCPDYLAEGVEFLEQDCSATWDLPDESLDLVFTSNFFEHLPDKDCLGRTLDEVRRCLRPGGRLIAMGPNIRYLPGAYWDYWDHYLPLTEKSLSEALTNRDYSLERAIPKFLPYTMEGKKPAPLAFVKAYLKLPLAWKFLGRQFLVIARK